MLNYQRVSWNGFHHWSNEEVWMIFPCKMLVDLYELLQTIPETLPRCHIVTSPITNQKRSRSKVSQQKRKTHDQSNKPRLRVAYSWVYLMTRDYCWSYSALLIKLQEVVDELDPGCNWQDVELNTSTTTILQFAKPLGISLALVMLHCEDGFWEHSSWLMAVWVLSITPWKIPSNIQDPPTLKIESIYIITFVKCAHWTHVGKSGFKSLGKQCESRQPSRIKCPGQKPKWTVENKPIRAGQWGLEVAKG
jgi:hypothetical protein